MLRQRRMLATVVALGLLTGCSAVALGHFGVQGLGELAGRIAAARVTALGHAIVHVPMQPIPEVREVAPPTADASTPSPGVADEPARPDLGSAPEPEPVGGQTVSEPVPVAGQPAEPDPPPSRSEPPMGMLPQTPVVLDGWLGRGERAEAPSDAAPAATSDAAPAATSDAAPAATTDAAPASTSDAAPHAAGPHDDATDAETTGDGATATGGDSGSSTGVVDEVLELLAQ